MNFFIKIMNRLLNIKKIMSNYSTITCKNCLLKIENNDSVYPNNKPNVATDALVIKDNDEILLIERKNNPFQGKFALPGGFVDYNEDPKDGCLRELLEEASIYGSESKLISVRSDPNRDPRGHCISFVYLVEVSKDQIPKGADDALSARFYNINEVMNSGKEGFAFDHYEIIDSYIKNRH